MVAEKYFFIVCENGDKSNNNENNLIVFATNSDHITFHKGGIRYLDGDVWKTKSIYDTPRICEYCHKEFYVNSTTKSVKYCSFECSVEARRYNKPSIEEMQKRLKELKGNFSALARELNVSSSGIAKLFKRHGLPNHSSDYK